ncbi:MAG: S1 RNA-binding domain-containing protein, partial [Clostridia bacterium]|nr:S1 RNA-binding domain-containing protein [Clostridia bacterium]
YKTKQLNGIVVEKNKETKEIVVSVKLLNEQVKQNAEDTFWNAAFLGKKVQGTVLKIMPYGAFIDVGGVDAFIHISDISHKRINSPSDELKVGETYEFRIIKLDKENKKVSVGLKQNTEDPKIKAIKELKFSEVYDGVVTKILPFGAIIELQNGASGLLHINDATEKNDKRIYEIVKQSDKVKVGVKTISDDNKVSFRLLQTF